MGERDWTINKRICNVSEHVSSGGIIGKNSAVLEFKLFLLVH
jgi:hypothetical protein